MIAPLLRLRNPDGPLTRELRRAPSGHGLPQVPEALAPDRTATLVCGFCSTGCGLDVHLRGGEAVNVTPSRRVPVNPGIACPKGWEALRVMDSPDRATTPLVRGANGKLAPVDWNAALALFVERVRAVQAKHGAAAMAFLGTGQIVTEELALLGTLAKFGMGMVHGDGNTRQCMASAATAYKQSFGFDAPPYTYADLEESDVVVLVGSNLAIAHPILWERLRRNRHRPAIVAIDPRHTETVAGATHHLPLWPKSDLALLYGLARMILHKGGVDRPFVEAHTSGFDEFAAFVDSFTPEVVASASGLEIAKIEEVADLIVRGERVSFWWTMGVNQSHEGTRVAQAIIDLALMTGNVGRPGTGANSVTGQCNAMGSRVFSNTSTLLGGREFTNATHRDEVAEILGIDVARVPDHAGFAYDQIIEGIASGAIRGLWIVATNSAHSWIGQNDLLDLLGRLDFLVVQDVYHTTETARLAHLVLPAAGWAEKEGTFINSERRIGRVHKVKRAPGQALADFSIFKLIAEAWGCGEMLRAWESPAAAFQILKRLSRGRTCDFSGITDHAAVDRAGGIQWPWTEEDAAQSEPAAERRLFADGVFPYADGRARFVFEAPRRLPESPSPAYPLLLLTGRASAAQWHTQTRTGKSAVLRKLHAQDAYVEVHPDDASGLGIATGEWVSVESQRGELRARAFVTPTIGRGQLFIPMHHATTNRLTDPAFDPYSRQPAYKACAVRIRRFEPSEVSS